MAVSIANAQAITMLDNLVDSCDLGSTDPNATLVIYSGTAPQSPDAALSGNTVLAELEMTNPAFGAAADVNPHAEAAANAISNDTSANATGTASFFRILDRNNTPRIQGSVTATGGGGDLELVTVSILATQPVQITSLVMRMREF